MVGTGSSASSTPKSYGYQGDISAYQAPKSYSYQGDIGANQGTGNKGNATDFINGFIEHFTDKVDAAKKYYSDLISNPLEKSIEVFTDPRTIAKTNLDIDMLVQAYDMGIIAYNDYKLLTSGDKQAILKRGGDAAGQLCEIIALSLVLKKFGTLEGTGKAIEGGSSVSKLPSAKGLFGKDFESYLTKNVGGEGSFSVGGRDFDGGIGNKWWEAKSGPYWENRINDPKAIAKFKSDMGDRLKIAQENGATYELFSNTPIPQVFKDYLIKKGIPFKEFLD